jgi:hypothetical protein
MNKTLIAGALVLGAAGCATGIVAAAGAQETQPTVGLAVAAKHITITGADALAAGPTTIRLTGVGKGDHGAAVFKLKPGVTHEQLERAARSSAQPSTAEKLGKFVASGFVGAGQSYTTSILLDRDTEYAVIRFGEKSSSVDGWFRTSDTSSNARLLDPDVRVTLRDYSFGGASTLPRDGVVQVLNAGHHQHHALILPLKKGVSTKRVLRDIKAGKEPRYAIAGAPRALTEIVSPATTNDVTQKLTPGKSLLVCFLQDSAKSPPHAALGMAKVVTVK